jgi:hypothetical protein
VLDLDLRLPNQLEITHLLHRLAILANGASVSRCVAELRSRV